jgi:hypothetical protein
MNTRRRALASSVGLGAAGTVAYQLAGDRGVVVTLSVLGLLGLVVGIVAVARWFDRSDVLIQRDSKGGFKLQTRPFHIDCARDEYEEEDRFADESVVQQFYGREAEEVDGEE